MSLLPCRAFLSLFTFSSSLLIFLVDLKVPSLIMGNHRFYYADERNADDSVAGGKIDGEAHAAFYWELAQRKE